MEYPKIRSARIHGDLVVVVLPEFPGPHLGAIERQLQMFAAGTQLPVGFPPLKGHLNGGVDFAVGKRLQQIAIGLGRSRPRQRRFFGVCREIDHRHIESGRNPGNGLDTVPFAVDVNIHQDDIGFLRCNFLQRDFAGRRRGANIIAKLGQPLPEMERDDCLILDDDDPGCPRLV